jgi:trk system potassium uptake protein TrkH
MGGIGFPILFNFLTYFKHLVVNSLKAIGKNNFYVYKPWIINMNTRIVVITTGILLIIGTGAFYALEYNNTLSEHSGFGKIVVAFFNSVTPRTAGFNNIDMSALTFAATMIIIFLMWVGASPGGTGGGIKTSTVAIATLISSALPEEKIVWKCLNVKSPTIPLTGHLPPSHFHSLLLEWLSLLLQYLIAKQVYLKLRLSVFQLIQQLV